MSNLMGNTNLYGLSVGLNRSFINNTLVLTFPVSLQRNDNSVNSAWVFTSSVVLNYRLLKNHSFSFNFNYIGNYSDDKLISPSFNEYKGAIQYIFTF